MSIANYPRDRRCDQQIQPRDWSFMASYSVPPTMWCGKVQRATMFYLVSPEQEKNTRNQSPDLRLVVQVGTYGFQNVFDAI